MDMGCPIPKSTFCTALEKMLPGLIFESYGRINSSPIQRKGYTLLQAILEMLFEMLITICLLNQSWVTHDYYAGVDKSFEFVKTPKGYEQTVPAIYAARRLKSAVSLSDDLVSYFKDLPAEERIRITNNQCVQEIPI